MNPPLGGADITTPLRATSAARAGRTPGFSWANWAMVREPCVWPAITGLVATPVERTTHSARELPEAAPEGRSLVATTSA